MEKGTVYISIFITFLVFLGLSLYFTQKVDGRADQTEQFLNNLRLLLGAVVLVSFTAFFTNMKCQKCT